MGTKRRIKVSLIGLTHVSWRYLYLIITNPLAIKKFNLFPVHRLIVMCVGIVFLLGRMQLNNLFFQEYFYE